MTAPNHALTGALIGLSISNPAIAMPLAFLSHLACDAIPHYDLAPAPAGTTLYRTKRFVYQFLVLGAGLCFALVVLLAATRPAHWVSAAVCAFLATSPDLFWVPRFVQVLKTGKDRKPQNWFSKLHAAVQWKTGPQFLLVELVWFVGCSALLWHFL